MALHGSLLLAFPVAVINSLARTKLVAAMNPVPVAVNSPTGTKLEAASPPVTIAAPLPVPVPPPHPTPFPVPLNRESFPLGFFFGTSTASYQYEGAVKEGGRGPSIWDTFTHKYPDRIADGSNGDVAVDFYHRYKEDVKLMKDMGMNAFRFSISWSRLLPRGTLSGGVNMEGIKFYNNLIDELRANDIEPFVTIFHWDVPHALEDEYGGFLSPRIVDDFRDFAELCFQKFGDRVKHWLTLNEPFIFSTMGYESGTHAPGRCSSWVSEACQAGNSATEPYVVGHHLLLCHAAAVQEYRLKYQGRQHGKIGIALNTHWMVPYSDEPHDHDAAERALDFMYGWFMDPLTHGDYPHCMRTLVRQRLPRFTEDQSKMVKQSFDFIGINYYTSMYAANVPVATTLNVRYSTDSFVNLKSDRDGIPIAPLATATWVRVYPNGLRDLLNYTKRKYNNPTIYITENGIDESIDSTLPLKEALEDHARVDYYYRHLLSLQRAISDDGAKVEGYFTWSLLDNFEWSSGYTSRFGMHFVDFKNALTRYPKHSAIWFKKFLKNGIKPPPIKPQPRDGENAEELN